MGTAIAMAPWVSLLVIIGTITYMVFRHRMHSDGQSKRMSEFNAFMIKEAGIPVYDPDAQRRLAKQKYDELAKSIDFGIEHETVTRLLEEHTMFPVKYFVWHKDDMLHLFPTKSVYLDSKLLEMNLIELVSIPLDHVVSIQSIEEDDIVEELRVKTQLTYKLEKKHRLLFDHKDLAVFEFMLPDKIEV